MLVVSRSFSGAGVLLALVAAMLVLSGCDEPKFDTSSADALQESRANIALDWGSDFWWRYNRAAAWLFAAREGWRKLEGRDSRYMLDRIEGDSQYEGGMDEAMFRLATDLASERVSKGGGEDAPNRDIGFELLRTEIDGKSASEFFALADRALPKARNSFNEFRRTLIDEFADDVKKVEGRYRAFLAEAEKVRVEVFGVRGVAAGLSQDMRFRVAQELFSFRLTNGTEKPIDRIVFVRGVKEVGLRKLIFDFPTPVAPGETTEKHDLSVGTGGDLMAAAGTPRFMNVRFADGAWFPRKDMERTYEEYVARQREFWEGMRDRLKGWRAQMAK